MIILTLTLIISSLLVTRKDNRIVLWPEYFDISVSKSRGRRVPTKLAVKTPTVEEIAKAAKKLKLNPKIESNKSYPGRWWRKTGRVTVQPRARKTKIIRLIAKNIKKKKN